MVKKKKKFDKKDKNNGIFERKSTIGSTSGKTGATNDIF